MRCFKRPCNDLRSLRAAVTSNAARWWQPTTSAAARQLSLPARFAIYPSRCGPRSLHTTAPAWRSRKEASREPQPADLNDLDVLGTVPAPSTSVDVCMYDGFGLNSGVTISDGNGALLVNGEAFAWRPWESKGAMELVNKKGQFELPAEAFGLFDLLWPRPDLLVIGVGKHNLPLSPQTRRHISELGIRVEVLDTRNAAAQFNLLATERGVSEVAAALIPMGWKEGVGAA